METNLASSAVFAPSHKMPIGSTVVKGYDFNNGIDYHQLFLNSKANGFQSTNFGLAVDQINAMIDKRNSPIAPEDVERMAKSDSCHEIEFRPKNNCTIFLGYTSNMASCGVRETIRFLVQHRYVDVLVTTAGGIEEDLIKCLAPTYIGDFSLDGRNLRDKGMNRIGNLLVPNDNYCLFEDWITPLFDTMYEEQKNNGVLWSPSKVIRRLGSEISNESSILYWAAKNDIPVFSPALTDGSLGDMLFFHSFKKPGFILDINQDLIAINSLAMKALHTAMILLGGGLIKHHICNANLMRNGADFAVFLNSSSEFDGSDAGARPDEAISWGKIKKDANPVKIYGEISFIFPLLVGETFARAHYQIN